jgi:hypothetical protein
MQPTYLDVKPGVDTSRSPLAVGQGMTDSNLVRYHEGAITKLGGCQHLNANPFLGAPLALFAGAENNGVSHITVGTTTHLEVLTGTAVTDITPAGFTAATEWSIDKWGENVVAVFPASTLYQWVPPVAGGNVAVAVTGAPTNFTGILIASPEQQLIGWGIYSASLGEIDPMLLGWCDVANLNDWTASATNQAGTFRLASGNKIMGGTWFGISGLVWTDLDLWAQSYVDFPLVYGFNQISRNCGLIARHAFAILGNVVPWMSQNAFFVFDGSGVTELPCSVHDFVFGSLDRTQVSRIVACANSWYDEIVWRFPTTGSNGVCNAYVMWNRGANIWFKGSGLPNIGAWADQSEFGPPVGADYAGLLQQFETAVDFDGAVLDDFFLTGWFAIQAGEEQIHLDRIWPDFVWQGTNPSLNITVYVAQNPQDPAPITYGPYTVTPTTQWFTVDASGMLMRFKIEGSGVAGVFWKYGRPMAQIAPDGRPL